MVRIGDLISSDSICSDPSCDLTVGEETSVEDVMQQMEDCGCEQVVVTRPGQTPAVLTKADVLQGLLCGLDLAQDKLKDLQFQVEGAISEQLDLVQQNVHTIAVDERNKLEIAVQSMHEGLILFGRRGEIEKANCAAKKMLGLSDEASMESVAAAIDELGFRELTSAKDTDGSPSKGDFKIKVSKNVILQIRWTELVDQWGHILGNVMTIRDISEEMATERAKTEFIASISHELRTPLTSIQNAVSNILAGVTGKVGKKTCEYLHAMKSDCHRFANLINDLLDIAKLEAGSMPISRRVMSMTSTLSEAVQHYAIEAREKNIELVCEIDGHVSPVFADSKRIQQVLWNLVANAVRFTDSGGKIKLRSYDSENDVITVVEDTGVGISADLQKQVFNKFYQIRRQAGPGSKGSGLGLAICNGIISVHGGSIWVESQAGKGSKFYFSLPKTDPFIVLCKHMSALAERGGNQFALMISNFDVPLEKREQLKGAVANIINEILSESDHFMILGEDLAIQTEPFETVFVVNDSVPNHIESIRQKIKKIVTNNLSNYCKGMPIVPMFGIGYYPVDSKEVKELEKAARRNCSEMSGTLCQDTED